MTRDAIETFSAFADNYEASRRLMIEPYDDFYGTTVDALALARRPAARVLELGAGTGALTRRVRAALPGAELVVCDGSAAMLAKARGTIEEPVEFVVTDLRRPLPAGRFDAVVSAMAIHHLEHDDQRDLYARVFTALSPGGIFVNGEVIGGAGAATIDAYQCWHHDSVRRHGGEDHDWHAYLGRQQADRCASLAQHLAWLTDAGFAEADCLFKQRLFGVLVGLKPG